MYEWTVLLYDIETQPFLFCSESCWYILFGLVLYDLIVMIANLSLFYRVLIKNT